MCNCNEKKFFYKDGRLKKIIPYIDGKINGIVKEYYNDGTLCSEIQYCDGLIDGYVKTYYENGSLESQESYKRGQKNNDLKIYNINGFEIFPSENNTLMYDEHNKLYHYHL